jgi:hypothetical protein
MRASIYATILIGAATVTKGSEAVTVVAAHGANQPQVAIDESERIHLTFGIGNSVYYSSSLDRGATFAPSTEVAQTKRLALGRRRGPRVAATRDSIVIAAVAGQRGDGRDGDLFTWHSRDMGRTWHGPAKVNDVASSAREGLHAMASAPSGDLFCAWLDLRNKGTRIFGSVSRDGGATWSENVLIYTSPDGSVCECCHPSVVYDGDGILHVMWRNSLAGNRDMYVATSRDGGGSFAAAPKLGSSSWQLKACPMDGGAIAANTAGELVAVWRRDRDICLVRTSLAIERRLGTGEQPWIAVDKSGIYAVWLEKLGGKLWLTGEADDRPTKLADAANFPVVAASPTGQGPVVVAWEAEEQGQPVVKAKVVSGPR